jgi:DNA repair protein RadC
MKKKPAYPLPDREKFQSISTPAELSVHYKNTVLPKDRIKVICPSDLEVLARQIFPEGEIDLREYCYAVFLNRANYVLGYLHLGTGNLSSCLSSHQVLLFTACKLNSASVALIHNHPSGSPYPSSGDILGTYNILTALKHVQIGLFDHLIITSESNYSMTSYGIINTLYQHNEIQLKKVSAETIAANALYQ